MPTVDDILTTQQIFTDFKHDFELMIIEAYDKDTISEDKAESAILALHAADTPGDFMRTDFYVAYTHVKYNAPNEKVALASHYFQEEDMNNLRNGEPVEGRVFYYFYALELWANALLDDKKSRDHWTYALHNFMNAKIISTSEIKTLQKHIRKNR